MPRVGEFCPSNIARLVLTVIIVVMAVAAVGFWLSQTPGHSRSIVHPSDK
jgi:hypothetical protein